MCKIVHIGNADNFMPPLIKFIKENCELKRHQFFFISDIHKFDYAQFTNVSKVKGCKVYINFILGLNLSDKIFLHGLFGMKTLLILFLQPWLLKKCYWVIWGGDLIEYRIPKLTVKQKTKEFIRKKVLKNIAHIMTHCKGDYKLAVEWYHTRAQYHNTFVYPSNLYKDFNAKKNEHTTINIQVGHSAYASSRHMTVFDLLKKSKEHNIKIITPLSYGSKTYAEEVIKYGYNLFGEKYHPITAFMPLEQYVELLSTIDIAVFDQDQQQGMGNIITLLGLGKTVYMRTDITSWQVFADLGIVVKSIDDFSLELLDQETVKSNIDKVKSYFSKEQLAKDLNRIFNR